MALDNKRKSVVYTRCEILKIDAIRVKLLHLRHKLCADFE